MAGTKLARVAILSPGDMGAGIGSVLHASGLDVITSLEGRSKLTRLRAEEAGFRDAGSLDAMVREADIVLSVLVPSEATSIAESVAAAMRRTGAAPAFAECNAIAPKTVLAIERLFDGTGATFIDAGIIGGPPRPGHATVRLHCSGPDTSLFEALKDHGLDIRVVGPRVGQASGLKMTFAASTKGTTALWTELMTAARKMGLETQLRQELGVESAVAKAHLNSIPGMPRRARRWVGEMEEIAATFADLGMTSRILDGAADMYRFIGETPLGEQTSREPDPTLEQVLEALAERLGE